MMARAARSTKLQAGPALLAQLPLAGLAAYAFACSSVQSPSSAARTLASPKTMMATNPEATHAAGRRLRSTLEQLAASARFALGHEDPTAYGVGWAEEADRSDVKSVCGSHPAVYGWDVFRLENGASENGDGVSFDLMRRRIQEAHQRGGINTVSWHADNPVSGGDAWDTTPAVRSIVPGGSHHAAYQRSLDRIADFFESCRGDDGQLIPLIFRPFHEHTGNWFWWGKEHATDADYIALWRFTVDYLRKQRGFTQLLFAFSPGGGDLRTVPDYLFRYPGDAYVDVMGVDHYYDTDVPGLLRAVSVTVATAEAHGKIPALTEFGIQDGLSELTPSNWFSKNFFEPVVTHPSAWRIAYALAWRNAGVDHCFVPYPGHPTAADFRRVCDDPRLVLQRDLPLVNDERVP
jgi:mannan endo-1,4-beta-mannosidase